MADLSVQQADLDAARAHLSAATAPVDDRCLAADAVGSMEVASALGDLDSLIRTALAALSTCAATAAGDLATVSTAFDEADASLAGGGG